MQNYDVTAGVLYRERERRHEYVAAAACGGRKAGRFGACDFLAGDGGRHELGRGSQSSTRIAEAEPKQLFVLGQTFEECREGRIALVSKMERDLVSN